MKTEKPKIKEKRLKHEIELEQRPEPLDGEAFDVWLKRIGGPNVKLLESLKEYKMPKSKEKTPLMINRNGNLTSEVDMIKLVASRQIFIMSSMLLILFLCFHIHHQGVCIGFCQQ